MSEHAQRAHAELGASSAHRWMACPGSIALSRGIPNVDSEYAREGTAAHELAEKCLHRDLDAAAFKGTTVNGFDVDDDMAEAVQAYLDAVRERAAGGTLWIEQRIDLHKLNPPAGMFGTADAMIHKGRRLSVVDLKYGKGHVVEVKNNPQLRYYGLGCLLSLPPGIEVDELEIVVVQPRAAHEDGIVRTEVVPIEEMLTFAGELIAAARETVKPNAPLVVGDHCRFCPAMSRCPAQAENAMALAQSEFAPLVGIDVTPAKLAPPDPRLMTPVQLSGLLPHLKRLEDWIRSVRATAQDLEMQNAGTIPGWKLVQKRANRTWTDERAVREYLQEFGLSPEEMETRELRSPAQIEKVVGKKAMPEHLIEKVSSGLTLAPEKDARPQVLTHPGAEFAALSASNDSYEED